jgi:flagellar protein FliJ
MAKFTFSLDSVLRWRVAQRDECRQAVAVAMRLAQQAQDRVTACDEELQQLSRHTGSAGTINIGQRIASDQYAAGLRRQRQRLIDELAARTTELESRRAALVDADREVRTLERLRERQVETFEIDERRREQRGMDELSLRNHLAEQDA